MKKNYINLLSVRKALLSFVIAALVMNGYAQKTITLYPAADIQFRQGNTAQSGTGPSFEIRTATAGIVDHAFVGGIRFDLTGLVTVDEVITKAELRLTSSQASKEIAIYPFTVDFGETGGTTDSWAAKETYIKTAVESPPVVNAFYPNWAQVASGSRKIFEWSDFSVRIKDYQIMVDVTDYFESKISASEYEIGLLLAPVSTSTADATIIFSKDASASSYGTAMTNGYNDDGTSTGGTNDVTRWSRIEQLLRISGNLPVSELYPMLTFTVEKGQHTGSIEIPANDISKRVISKTYYDLLSRQVLQRAQGVLIEKTVYDDGSVSCKKVYILNNY